MIHRLVGAILLLLGAGTPLSASCETLTGRVVGVTDGDTLSALVAGRPVKVRLVEIDAPEKDQAWGQKSKAALSDLVFAKSVTLQSRGQDRYGRTLARVYVGGQDVNAAMIRTGAAWAYRDYLTDRSLIALEGEARSARRGLWSLSADQIVAPWDWRHGARIASARPVAVHLTASASGLACGSKHLCRQMTSCQEAQFYLRQCRVTSLDGNHDGVPCESLCRSP